MSRSWRSEIRIALCPDRVAALKISGIARRRVESEALWSCDEAEAAPAWRASVDVLHANISQFGSAARVAVILSNRFAHYALFHPPATVARREHARYVEHKLRNVFGDLSARWTVRVARSPKNGALLVAGVETALLDAIKEALGPALACNACIQPHFSVDFNRLRRRLSAPSGWFVMQEERHALIGRLVGGEWQSLARRYLSASSPEGLISAVDREHALQNLAEPIRKVYLLAPRNGMRAPSLPPYEVEILQKSLPYGFPLSAARDYEMAA